MNEDVDIATFSLQMHCMRSYRKKLTKNTLSNLINKPAAAAHGKAPVGHAIMPLQSLSTAVRILKHMPSRFTPFRHTEVLMPMRLFIHELMNSTNHCSSSSLVRLTALVTLNRMTLSSVTTVYCLPTFDGNLGDRKRGGFDHKVKIRNV